MLLQNVIVYADKMQLASPRMLSTYVPWKYYSSLWREHPRINGSGLHFSLTGQGCYTPTLSNVAEVIMALPHGKITKHHLSCRCCNRALSMDDEGKRVPYRKIRSSLEVEYFTLFIYRKVTLKEQQ
jgi:hypothetical protein